MRVKTWDEPRVPDDVYLETVRVELSPAEREALALKVLLQVGEEVMRKRAALEEAVARLRHTIDLHAEGRYGGTKIPRDRMRSVLGPLYAQVEQVGEWPEVAEEGVATPEPETAALRPQDTRGAVEQGHPAPDFVLPLGEAHGGAVGHEEHR